MPRTHVKQAACVFNLSNPVERWEVEAGESPKACRPVSLAKAPGNELENPASNMVVGKDQTQDNS